MTVDFSTLMPAHKRAYFARVEAEITRLFALPDAFLARAMVTHARAARDRYPDFLKVPEGRYHTCLTRLTWDIVPEIAYRLGERSFLAGERSTEVRMLSGDELRQAAGNCLKEGVHSPGDMWSERYDYAADPLEVLTHDVANGNPVAFSVDRVCPALQYDRNDPIMRYVAEVSETRGFEPPHLMWRPDMQDYESVGSRFSLT